MFSVSQSGCGRFGGGDRRVEKEYRKDAASILEDEKNGIFRVLDIGKPTQSSTRKELPRRQTFSRSAPPRHTVMKPDQDWGNVWPAARTFHPAVVPLPVRQGVSQIKNQLIPSKYANTELIKIPNFLHLTPPVVAKHCSAIKKFCTPWPAGLNTDQDIEKHFPVQVITSNYLNSSSSLRDRRSRVVVVRFKLSSLQLDKHARDKMIRLLGDRYNEKEDMVELTTDRCPYRGQNLDYSKYLITALYFESWKTEPWEVKEHLDRELYELEEDEMDDFQKTLQKVLNLGEDEQSLREYKEAARKHLNICPQNVTPALVQNS